MFFIFPVVLLLQAPEVQYKHVQSTCQEGPVITILKAIRNILNHRISSESPQRHGFYNAARSTGVGTSSTRNIPPFSCTYLLGTDNQQKRHWIITPDQCTEGWTLKLNPNSFVSVEEVVLGSSLPSPTSLYDTLTGKQSPLHFSEPKAPGCYLHFYYLSLLLLQHFSEVPGTTSQKLIEKQAMTTEKVEIM